MRASKSQDPAAPEEAEDRDDMPQSQGSGSGAASALERMKAQQRHRKQHGPRHSGPGHDEDSAPDR